MSAPSTRRTRLSLLAAVTLLAGAGALTLPASGAAPHQYKEYVALGDSWTADVLTELPPTTDEVPIDCGQSARNYPHQVAAVLGIPKFRDASCGSATSDHFANPQTGLPAGGTNPPQFDRLTKNTDLVTIGIGGNDIGLAAAAEGCISVLPVSVPGVPAPVGNCRDAFTTSGPNGTDEFDARIKASTPRLIKAVNTVKKLSPKAKIFLVNYINGLPVTGKGCWPIVPVQDGDMAYMQGIFLKMNAMVATVAKATKVNLVDAYTPTIGHDVCQGPTVRYVEGFVPVSVQNPLLVNFPVHPNQSGANAQAREVIAAIRAAR